MNHEENGVFFLPMMFLHCQLTDFERFMSSLDVNFVASGPTHESVLCFYIRQTLPGCVHECKYQCREVSHPSISSVLIQDVSLLFS